jgi:hypothetical protein
LYCLLAVYICFCSIASLLLAKPVIIEFSATSRLDFRPFLELDYLLVFWQIIFLDCWQSMFSSQNSKALFDFPPCLEQVVPNSRRCQVILSFFFWGFLSRYLLLQPWPLRINPYFHCQSCLRLLALLHHSLIPNFTSHFDYRSLTFFFSCS